eukprot:gene1432-32805_t
MPASARETAPAPPRDKVDDTPFARSKSLPRLDADRGLILEGYLSGPAACVARMLCPLPAVGVSVQTALNRVPGDSLLASPRMDVNLSGLVGQVQTQELTDLARIVDSVLSSYQAHREQKEPKDCSDLNPSFSNQTHREQRQPNSGAGIGSGSSHQTHSEPRQCKPGATAYATIVERGSSSASDAPAVLPWDSHCTACTSTTEELGSSAATAAEQQSDRSAADVPAATQSAEGGTTAPPVAPTRHLERFTAASYDFKPEADLQSYCVTSPDLAKPLKLGNFRTAAYGSIPEGVETKQSLDTAATQPSNQPSTQPSTPATQPSTPSTQPSTPSTQLSTQPATPATQPSTPSTQPSTQLATPATPSTQPSTPSTQPSTPANQPATQSATPSTQPSNPATQPATQPSTPAIQPSTPATQPSTPATQPATQSCVQAPATGTPVDHPPPVAKPAVQIQVVIEPISITLIHNLVTYEEGLRPEAQRWPQTDPKGYPTICLTVALITLEASSRAGRAVVQGTLGQIRLESQYATASESAGTFLAAGKVFAVDVVTLDFSMDSIKIRDGPQTEAGPVSHSSSTPPGNPGPSSHSSSYPPGNLGPSSPGPSTPPAPVLSIPAATLSLDQIRPSPPSTSLLHVSFASGVNSTYGSPQPATSPQPGTAQKIMLVFEAAQVSVAC